MVNITKMNTIDKIKNKLVIQASYMVLQEHIDIPLIKKLLNTLAEQNIYSDTFIDIIFSDTEYTSEEFYPILNKALKAIDCPIPKSPQEAIDAIIQYHLRRIVEQKKDVCTEMGELSILYKNDGNYAVFGPAQRLYEAYVEAMNTYPFVSDQETVEEKLELDTHLFKIAKHCLLNIVTKEEVTAHGVEFIAHQLRYGPVHIYKNDTPLFVALSPEFNADT